MRERLCPVCRVELKPQIHLGITIDVCPTCAGIWFDQDELTRITQIDPEILPQLDQLYQPVVHSYDPPWEKLCPVCREVRLRPYHYLYNSDIELDECVSCGGIWVENSELEKMASVLQDARVMDVPPEAQAETILAQVEAEHRQTMGRLEFFKGLFRFLSARPRI